MKIAFVVIKLVDESVEKSNVELEKEIEEELSKNVVPWMREIEKVTVLENSAEGSELRHAEVQRTKRDH